MKTEQEIIKILEDLKANEQNYYKTATVFSNAPLALIQYGLSSKINILETILDLPLSTFPLTKEQCAK